MVVFGVATTTNKPAEAAPQAENVCVSIVVSACVQVTATVRVTLPPVTEIVTLPPVVRTIIQPRTVTLPPLVGTRTVVVPAAPVTRTVTVPQPGLPGATKTATVVVSREVVRNGTAPPVTREVRTTMSSPGQAVTSSATVTPSKEVVRIPGTTKTVTKFQAVGLSLLGLLALMGLGWFLLWLGFVLGYKSADKENTSFLRALRDTARRRPGKHE
jgi:hypothetical protein